MSEYELVSLLGQYSQALQTNVGLYASILFAFIVAIFFAGPKLPNWVLLTITAIYSLFGFLTAAGVFNIISRVVLVLEDLSLISQNSSSIVVQGIGENPVDAGLYYWLYTILIVGSYIGSIAFLVYVMRQKRRGHAST